MVERGPIFEEGVAVIADHRLAVLDFATSEGFDEDVIDERSRVVDALGVEVAALQLVVPAEEFRSMTEEACQRLKSLSELVDGAGDEND